MKRDLRTLTLGLLLVVTASACTTSRRYFRPAEGGDAETPNGFSAAQYELVHEGARWGEVRVWSEGAREDEDGDRDITVVHIGIEVENTTDAELSVDLAYTVLDEVGINTTFVDGTAANTITGEPTTNAHSVSQLHLDFVMPEGTSPRDIDSFRLRWRVLGPNDVFYEQFTPFVRERRRSAPYWGPTWSFGFGYSTGWCW